MAAGFGVGSDVVWRPPGGNGVTGAGAFDILRRISRPLVTQRGDVAIGRICNLLDQPGKLIVGPGHFRQVTVPVIRAANAGEGVAKAALADVGGNTGAA